MRTPASFGICLHARGIQVHGYQLSGSPRLSSEGVKGVACQRLRTCDLLLVHVCMMPYL